MKKVTLGLIALIILLANTCVFAQDIKIPKLTSPVVDKANLLSFTERKMLQKKIKTIFNKGGPQIQILTVENLQGLEIEEFSILVAEKWKIGSKEVGNGVIITVAKEERKVRIEVGDGIEGELTDYKSNQIIQNHMIPYFKIGNYAQGLKAAIFKINKLLLKSRSSFGGAKVLRSSTKDFLLKLCIGIVIFIIMFFVLDKKVETPAKKILSQMGLCFIIIYVVTFSFLLTLVLSIMLPSLLSIKTYSDRNPYPNTDTMSTSSNQYENEKIILVIQILDILFGSGGRGGGFGGGGSSSGGGWSGGGGGFSGGGSSGSW